MKKRRIRNQIDLRMPMILLSIMGAFLLLLISLLIAFYEYGRLPTNRLLPYAGFLITMDLIICICVLVPTLIRYRKIAIADDLAKEMTTEISDLFRYVLDLPYAIVDEEGQVKIISGALQNLLQYKIPVCNVPLSNFCSVSMESIIAFAQNGGPLKKAELNEDGIPGEVAQELHTEIGGKIYDLRCYVLRSRGKDYYFVMFADITKILTMKKLQNDNRAVVAYVVIDSLQELSQYARISYQEAVAHIGLILKEWAASMGGMIKEYEREKYLIVFKHEELDRCVAQKFKILDRVREVRLGEQSFPVTVSIGIGSIEGSFEDKERAASDALDVALQRGGDQATVNDGKNITPYGGRTNASYGSAAVTSRVNSEYLCRLMQNAGNVLIMGHRSPDYDSIGSCIGLARLAICARGGDASRVRVVVDREHSNFRNCYDLISNIGDYNSMFISGDTGLDSVRSNTLLILSDVSNVYNTEAPKLIKCVKDIVIVDHHRRPDQMYDFKPLMTYIRPSVAAASELVGAMIQYSPYSNKLLREEATLMLAGIMLDTKNFTAGAEMQTFSVVHYLYGRGAHTSLARGLFSESMTNLFTACDINSRTRTYRDIVALTWLSVDHNATEEDRLVVAKAADNLMTLNGIEASFAILHADNTVIISARSRNKINVQLIMQALGGGGHFDMAAATLTHTSLEAACSQLKNVIDDYLDHEMEDKD